MATFVLVHGAWAGGWRWLEVPAMLRAAGHEVYTPTLTGLGERVHLASPEVGLDTHVLDIVNLLRYEELHDVILVGHSYGGMVITGVAQQAPERLVHLIYLDALIPEDGQSVLDILGPEVRAGVEEQARLLGDGWRIPLNPPDPRHTDQPLRTWTQPLAVRNPKAAALPRTCIYCTEKGDVEGRLDGIQQCAIRSRAQGWRYRELAAGHCPMDTIAPELVRLLLEAV